jgi:peptidoglycan/LPS O-acetylase OafA/YrhL
MKRKNVGLMLMVLSFLYFVSAVWGSFQMGGVGAAAPISVVLILFIGGVWCLSSMKRKRLGLVLMVLPFLLNVGGIWGGYQMGSEEGGEMGGLVGAMINVLALIIFGIGVWCLSKPESEQD